MFNGTSINNSPVIAGIAAEKLEEVAFLAVKFDDDGNIVVANTQGEAALGILPAEQENIEAGGTVTVQIRQCGLWKTGDAVAAGDLLATDATGKAVKASAGEFVLGIALEAASAANEVIQVQLAKAGYAAE